MMAALRLLFVTILVTSLALLTVMATEAAWCARKRIKQGLRAFSLRIWCATPTVWLKSFLARLGRV